MAPLRQVHKHAAQARVADFADLWREACILSRTSRARCTPMRSGRARAMANAGANRSQSTSTTASDAAALGERVTHRAYSKLRAHRSNATTVELVLPFIGDQPPIGPRTPVQHGRGQRLRLAVMCEPDEGGIGRAVCCRTATSPKSRNRSVKHKRVERRAVADRCIM